MKLLNLKEDGQISIRFESSLERDNMSSVIRFWWREQDVMVSTDSVIPSRSSDKLLGSIVSLAETDFLTNSCIWLKEMDMESALRITAPSGFRIYKAVSKSSSIMREM